MYFNSSSTLLFHFNTFTAAVAEVPQLIVPRAGKGVVTHQIDRLLRGSTRTRVCSCMPSQYFTQSTNFGPRR